MTYLRIRIFTLYRWAANDGCRTNQSHRDLAGSVERSPRLLRYEARKRPFAPSDVLRLVSSARCHGASRLPVSCDLNHSDLEPEQLP